MTLTTPHATTAPTLAPVSIAGPRSRRPVSPRKQWFASHPAWSVTALLAAYPLWWALGLADESVIILAVPMVLRMRSWHRGGQADQGSSGLRVVAALPGLHGRPGALTLGLAAPGTVVSPLFNRLLAFGIRGLTYVTLTVILLYAGNLTEMSSRRQRLAWLLGLVGIYTVGRRGRRRDRPAVSSSNPRSPT